MEALTPDAVSISKLMKPPVEVEFGIYEVNPNYVETDDPEENLKNFYIRVGTSKPFLHPLSWVERNFIKADVIKVYRFWKDQDGEDRMICNLMTEEAVKKLTVYFALKVGPEPKSERVFKSQEEILEYHHQGSINELNSRYYDEFGMTDKEWGNLLRARSLKISSDLPAISPDQKSLDESSQS